MRGPAASLAALAAACTTIPAGPIPDPLPETLAWNAPEVSAGAFLGLEVRENDSGSLETLRFERGVRVTLVAAGSPAREAGIEVGDVVLAFGEIEVADPATLAALLREAEPDRVHDLEVLRGDAVFSVPVRLRAREGAAGEAELAWRADPARSRAGWRSTPGGVALVTSDPRGPFPRAGVDVGSVVTALDGEPVRSDLALIRALSARAPGAEVEVRYRAPGDETERVETVELYAPGRRVTRAGVPILIGYSSSTDGERSNFYLLDLWLISLFEYRRDGAERHFSLLSLLRFESGVGELEEVRP